MSYGLSVMKNGKRKYTVLFRRWLDIRSRVRGRVTRCPELYMGLEVGWDTFAEFRAFALANGFCKARSSPDRQRSHEGYVPGNVKFVPPRYNCIRALHGDDWRGEEPPHDSYCDCSDCIPGFAA